MNSDNYARGYFEGSRSAGRGGDMSITPEICTHCGQTIKSDSDYADLWLKYLLLKNALIRCNTSLSIFEVKKISDLVLQEI